MKYAILLLTISFAFLFSSCGEKVDDLKNIGEVIQKAPEIANNIEKSQKEAQEIKAERKKRGDIAAVPYDKLQKYLPEKIDGYTSEEPAGETIDMQGLSYSNVSRDYVKTNADGTQNKISVSIFDYNAVETMFASAAYWVTGIKKEDATTKEATFDPGIKYTYGFESYNKVNKEVKISYAVAYRFLITIEGDGQTSTEYLKGIAKAMKIDELAKM